MSARMAKPAAFDTFMILQKRRISLTFRSFRAETWALYLKNNENILDPYDLMCLIQLKCCLIILLELHMSSSYLY